MTDPYPSFPAGPPAGGPAGGEPPPSNLVWGIVTLVLCGGVVIGLVTGIVSVVNASQVGSRWAAGDRAGAYEASRKARLWALWGLVLSLALFLVVLVVVLVAALSGAMDDPSVASG